MAPRLSCRCALGLVLGLFALAACEDSKPASEETEQDRLPESLSVVATSTKLAFEKNWQVSLVLENHADTSYVLNRLDATSAKAMGGTGTECPIHRLSVGHAKPLEIPRKGRKRTSLLFEACEERPAVVILKGRRIPIAE